MHPLFWLIAIFLGLSTRSLMQLLIWVIVVFISILLHELGHSIAMRLYGQHSSIVLHMAGGLAIPESSRWGGRWQSDTTQQIVISLAGPLAGFFLAGLVLAVVALSGGSISINWLLGFIPLPSALIPGGGIANSVVRTLLWVNIFWGLINLVPVIPLDGGHVARNLFLKVDPWDGLRKSLWLSTISGAVVATASLVFLGSLFMALLFGLLAFQSYQLLRGHGGMF